jgi:hypothetical protein
MSTSLPAPFESGSAAGEIASGAGAGLVLELHAVLAPVAESARVDCQAYKPSVELPTASTLLGAAAQPEKCF